MNAPVIRRIRGFSLLEVMIAVILLSFGLLALATLQASLFRAGAESKARANAVAVAQQVIENAHTYAYVTGAPAGDTYLALASASLDKVRLGGIDFEVSRTVTRYIFDPAKGAFQEQPPSVGYNAGLPEFKQVDVSVSWTGDAGSAKTVTLTDTVSAIAPADTTQVLKPPGTGPKGPIVLIEPPGKDNPTVVPIAIGTDQSAASSNPKPQQFIQDISAATTFNVLTFTGAASANNVLLNRKLDVAAVSCVCSREDSPVSTTSTPAFKPAVWNGRRLAYDEPERVAPGTPIATAVVSASTSDIETLCTVCCRDHHEVAARNLPRPDPWRPVPAAGEEHYGYKRRGSAYETDTLLPLGTDTDNRYVDACQLVRVDGIMRIITDADQAHLAVTPLSVDKKGYADAAFVEKYSGFVTGAVSSGVSAVTGTLKDAYPGPEGRFPRQPITKGEVAVDFGTLAFNDPAIPRGLVAFGLYVDYLSPDTLKAYKCALDKNNAGDCIGLGSRNALETIPFYAVNVANLGSWASEYQGTVAVENATYNAQGLLSTDGGTLLPVAARFRPDPFDISLEIGVSNSGLTATLPVDPDDKLDFNFSTDRQVVSRTGTATSKLNNLSIATNVTSTLTLSAVDTRLAGGNQCPYANKTKTSTCRFVSNPFPGEGIVVSFGQYVTSTYDRKTNVTTISDRQICVPTDLRVGVPTVSNPGTISEVTSVRMMGLGELDYRLLIAIVGQGETCPSGLTLTP